MIRLAHGGGERVTRGEEADIHRVFVRSCADDNISKGNGGGRRSKLGMLFRQDRQRLVCREDKGEEQFGTARVLGQSKQVERSDGARLRCQVRVDGLREARQGIDVNGDFERV